MNLAFYHLPGMFLFIEPYGPILIAALCMAIALGMGIQAAFGRGQTLTERIAGSVFLIAAVSSAFLSNLATVTGAIFHEQMNFLPNVHVRLPGDWVSSSKVNSTTTTAAEVSSFCRLMISIKSTTIGVTTASTCFQ